MEEFDALVHSLGEHCVAYIGKENLRRLDVFGDVADSTAFIEIYLEENVWERQAEAIDKMIEIRGMFIDELSIDYRFVDEDSSTVESAEARRSLYSLV